MELPFDDDAPALGAKTLEPEPEGMLPDGERIDISFRFGQSVVAAVDEHLGAGRVDDHAEFSE